MLRGLGATAPTTLRTKLGAVVDGVNLPLRRGDSAPILKQRLQSENCSLFLRLFFLLDQNPSFAKVQRSS
jgi:hypothetical protein